MAPTEMYSDDDGDSKSNSDKSKNNIVDLTIDSADIIDLSQSSDDEGSVGKPSHVLRDRSKTSSTKSSGAKQGSGLGSKQNKHVTPEKAEKRKKHTCNIGSSSDEDVIVLDSSRNEVNTTDRDRISRKTCYSPQGLKPPPPEPKLTVSSTMAVPSEYS